MRTKEKLAQALKAANAPQWMVDNALAGQYDDFESDSAMPCVQLVIDCQAAGLEDMANRAKNGEFDATHEESEAWFQREGKNLI
jgi:hypothetical protein